jgi:hypothetical protein
MGKPESMALQAVKSWLDGGSGGPGGRQAPSLSGLSGHRLDDENDLIAVHPPHESDLLSRLAEIPYLKGSLFFVCVLDPFDGVTLIGVAFTSR